MFRQWEWWEEKGIEPESGILDALCLLFSESQICPDPRSGGDDMVAYHWNRSEDVPG